MNHRVEQRRAPVRELSPVVCPLGRDTAAGTDGRPRPDGSAPAPDVRRPAPDGLGPSPAPSPDGDGGEEVRRLREEVAQLRAAMESRPVVDQARGYLMAVGPCSARQAWEVLVHVSQHTNTKLRAVAGALLATSDGTPLEPALRSALARALEECAGARRTRNGRRARGGPSRSR